MNGKELVQVPETSKDILNNLERKCVERLEDGINKHLSDIAVRETNDIERKMDFASENTKKVFFAMQLTEYAKSLGHPFLAGYMENGTQLSDTTPILSEQEISSIGADLSNYSEIYISDNLNDNLALDISSNMELMSQAVLSYELEMENEYREERNKDINTDLDDFFHGMSKQEVLDLAAQSDRYLEEAKESLGIDVSEIYNQQQKELEDYDVELTEEDIVFE